MFSRRLSDAERAEIEATRASVRRTTTTGQCRIFRPPVSSDEGGDIRDFGAPGAELAEVDRPEPGGDDVGAHSCGGICYRDVLPRRQDSGQPARSHPRHEIAGDRGRQANVAPRAWAKASLCQRLFCGACRRVLPASGPLPQHNVLGEQAKRLRRIRLRARAQRDPLTRRSDMTAAALAVCPVGTVRAALGVAALEPGQAVLITGAGGGWGRINEVAERARG
jgi:D-arabinose 1-dehydrogenase-like Zn-dependent alcohol dehydrogenase